jgi:hypothetical protein
VIYPFGSHTWTTVASVLGLTLYGHVVYSNPDDDAYRTGIFIEPALLDSTNVIELVKNYLIAAAGRS